MNQSADTIYGINPVLKQSVGRRDIHRVWLYRDGGKNPRLRKLGQFLEAFDRVEAADRAQLYDLGTREHQGVVFEGAPFPIFPMLRCLAPVGWCCWIRLKTRTTSGAIMRSAEVFGWGMCSCRARRRWSFPR